MVRVQLSRELFAQHTQGPVFNPQIHKNVEPITVVYVYEAEKDPEFEASLGYSETLS